MIDPDWLLDSAKARGRTFWAGLPCSFLAPMFNALGRKQDITWTNAASEGEALAIAAKGTFRAALTANRAIDSNPAGTRLIGQFTRRVDDRCSRIDALITIRRVLGSECALISTTGKTGRELSTLGDHCNQLYVVGSMGCASAIGLGVHTSSMNPCIAVIDGDGAVRMRMRVLATIGHYHPERFVHIVLDNEAHDATGAQATSSSTVDFALIAHACGYRHVWRTDYLNMLRRCLEVAVGSAGPSLIHMKIAIGSIANLGRPPLSPPAVRERFMNWLTRPNVKRFEEGCPESERPVNE